MKLIKQHSLLLCILSAILVTSCGQMKEEIVINKDGSGVYEMSFDMIPMMRGMMMGMSKMSEEGMFGEGVDSLELVAQLEEQIWSKFPDEVDSVMDLTRGAPPAISNDPAKMAIVEKATAFMRGGKSKGYLLSGVNYEFDDAADLEKFMEILKEGNKGDSKVDMLMGNSDTEMILTSNSFYRSQKIEPSEDPDADLSKARELFEGAGITTVITAPKKIKKLKVKTYKIVERKGNKVTLKIDMLDYFTATESAEVEITW